MQYRLLVDLEAIEILNGLQKKVRTRLFDHFYKLRASPDRHSDYYEHDATGRRIEISVFSGHAIHYWIDFADRHVKILAIKSADI